jgi:hypothetical protein
MTLRIDERGMRKVQDDLAGGFTALGRAIEEAAQENAPVLTGRLRASIHVLVYVDGRLVHGSGPTPDGLTGRGIEVFVGSDTGYGRWVHDGTVDTAPVPFLALALAQVRPRAASIVKGGR